MSYPAFAQQPRVMPLRPAAPRPAATSGYASQASRYREAELSGAAPGQLVVMLLDRCILTIRRAQAAFAAGNIAERGEMIGTASDMVGTLRCALDFTAGPEATAISRQLDGLYAFVLRELFESNRRKDAAKLEPLVRVLGDLRDGFAGAQAQLASAAPPARARSA